MAKENQVIQMYGTVAATAYSIDVPDDGLILGVHMAVHGTLNAEDEGVEASLEFGSVTARTTNDARQVIAWVGSKLNLLTTGGGGGIGNSIVSFAQGIRVFGGERLYLHTAVLGTGVFIAARALILFNFASFVARRR